MKRRKKKRPNIQLMPFQQMSYSLSCIQQAQCLSLFVIQFTKTVILSCNSSYILHFQPKFKLSLKKSQAVFMGNLTNFKEHWCSVKFFSNTWYTRKWIYILTCIHVSFTDFNWKIKISTRLVVYLFWFLNTLFPFFAYF